jgi:hypothetical protein
MEVSGQLHTLVALTPGKEPLVPIGQEAVWVPEPVWTLWWREKFPTPAGTRTLDHPASSPMLYHWAILAPTKEVEAEVKVKVKVKLSLCFNWTPRHEGVLGEWKYSSTHSLTSALGRCGWSASRHGRFTPEERAPGTHWIGGWVCLRAVLDAVVKRKIRGPLRESNPRTPTVQPVAQRYIDLAVTALQRRVQEKIFQDSNPLQFLEFSNILGTNSWLLCVLTVH